MSLRVAAVRLADGGCHVFPCEPGGKRPACKHGFHDASRDRGRVVNWWRSDPARNIGIATEGSGLAVVDLDGADGIANWRTLLAEHPGTPATLTASTPSGGCHQYYRADPARPLRSTAGQLAAHVDTRGAGGYVVAPPSRRPDGRYRWHAVPDRLPDVPAWGSPQLAARRPDARKRGAGPSRGPARDSRHRQEASLSTSRYPSRRTVAACRHCGRVVEHRRAGASGRWRCEAGDRDDR